MGDSQSPINVTIGEALQEVGAVIRRVAFNINLAISPDPYWRGYREGLCEKMKMERGGEVDNQVKNTTGLFQGN